MSTAKHSKRRVFIVTAAKRDQANSVMQGMGYGPNNLSVPVIPVSRGQGEPPPSHYLCDWQMTEGESTRITSALSEAGIAIKDHDRGHWDPAKATKSISQVMTDESLKRL